MSEIARYEKQLSPADDTVHVYPPGRPVSDTTKKFYADLSPSVVEIQQIVGPNHKVVAIGSGFFLDKEGHVGTVKHVVEDEDHNILPQLRLITKSGKPYFAHLVALGDTSQAAVLQIDGAPPPDALPVKLPKEKAGEPTADDSLSGLEPFDPIRALGHPEGLHPVQISAGGFGLEQTMEETLGSCQKTAIASYLAQASEPAKKDVQDELSTVSFSATIGINVGSSGGPVFDKNEIAIAAANKALFGAATLVPISYFQALLDDLKNNNQNAKFSIAYTQDQHGHQMVSAVTRKDGSGEPPYRYQIDELIKKKCSTLTVINR